MGSLEDHGGQEKAIGVQRRFYVSIEGYGGSEKVLGVYRRLLEFREGSRCP